MDHEIQPIEYIHFGLMSKDEILRNSVAEINVNRISGMHALHSVYDPRMGPMQVGQTCDTCTLQTKHCPGHFGHIQLNISVIHPLYYKMVLAFLKCFCIDCSYLLVTRTHLRLWGLLQLKGYTRFNAILTQIQKTRICLNCNLSQPKFTFSSPDTTYFATYKIEGKDEKVKLGTDEIKIIFERIQTQDIELLGLNPKYVHPSYLIMDVFPVLPPRSRPFIVTDHAICDDDLTIQLVEIIKANNHLVNTTITENKREKYIQSLLFRIKTFYDNSQLKAKHTNARAIKGLKERLTGKDGLIRSNLMGKRVNQSGRTVICGDPTLELDQLGVPHDMCDILTYPVHVFKHNLQELQQLVWNDGANIVKRGDIRYVLKYALAGDKRYAFFLQEGDIVERKLQDDDYVFVNRQPTLHKGSLLAKRVKRLDGKTLRLNVATTSTFNADFDGDEMNVFPATSECSRAELELIAGTKHNIIGSQSSKPLIKIVQDNVLAAFIMTCSNEEIPPHVFTNITMTMTNIDDHAQLIQQTCHDALDVMKHTKCTPFPLYSGKTLFSLLLPRDFSYRCLNKANVNEPVVMIDHGILYQGAINKANLSSSHTSLITLLHKEYSPEIALQFINNVQFITNAFMLYHGFSIGIDDCIATKQHEIDHALTRCFIEAQGIEETIHNPFIRETKMNMALSKAKDMGMKIATNALSQDNGFITTVTSGSKGDFFNIAQITGLLGQQNITGERVPLQLNHRQRTLPHYPLHITDKSTEFESRGFIKQSFFHGLSPQAFWFHAMTGREGITDTSLKTSSSGYIQRKMVKVMEDVQVKYDSSVRNAVHSIIQFAYGGDNLCGSKTIIKDDTPHICNIKRLVEQIHHTI